MKVNSLMPSAFEIKLNISISAHFVNERLTLKGILSSCQVTFELHQPQLSCMNGSDLSVGQLVTFFTL